MGVTAGKMGRNSSTNNSVWHTPYQYANIGLITLPMIALVFLKCHYTFQTDVKCFGCTNMEYVIPADF